MSSDSVVSTLATVTAEELGAAFGGAPRLEPGVHPGEDEKASRKRRKWEAKIRRDCERPPNSFERFRILAELVSEGRQVVDLADHKARYALVVLGALNAGVFFLIARAHLIADVSPLLKPWLLGFLIVYAGLTFLFILYAVDCIRPRRLPYTELVPRFAPGTDGVKAHVPRGVLFWEGIGTYELADYRRAWSEIHMEQINGEVVGIAHGLALLIRAKYAALGKLFMGLAVLIGLAGMLLVLLTALSLIQQQPAG